MNYSVPHDLARRTLDVKLTAERVVAYDDGIEVASHSRLHGAYGQYSTRTGHTPENHRNMKSPEAGSGSNPGPRPSARRRMR